MFENDFSLRKDVALGGKFENSARSAPGFCCFLNFPLWYCFPKQANGLVFQHEKTLVGNIFRTLVCFKESFCFLIVFLDNQMFYLFLQQMHPLKQGCLPGCLALRGWHPQDAILKLTFFLLVVLSGLCKTLWEFRHDEFLTLKTF